MLINTPSSPLIAVITEWWFQGLTEVCVRGSVETVCTCICVFRFVHVLLVLSTLCTAALLHRRTCCISVFPCIECIHGQLYVIQGRELLVQLLSKNTCALNLSTSIWPMDRSVLICSSQPMYGLYRCCALASYQCMHVLHVCFHCCSAFNFNFQVSFIFSLHKHGIASVHST